MVGAAPSDEVDGSVDADGEVAERARQIGEPVVEGARRVGLGVGDVGAGVVPDEAVDRTPGTLAVAVVSSPAGDLDVLDAPLFQLGDDLYGRHRTRHEASRHEEPLVRAG